MMPKVQIRHWLSKSHYTFLVILSVYFVTRLEVERPISADLVDPVVQARAKRVASVKNQIEASATAATGPIQKVDSELAQMMAEDELEGANPYADLSTPVSLQEIFNRGVTGFERKTYRSSTYKETFGYDLVTYEVKHKKGSSVVLAHTEKTDLEGFEPKVYVVFINPLSDGIVRWTQYEDQLLAYDRVLSEDEAKDQLASLTRSSVPFLSVSR